MSYKNKGVLVCGLDCSKRTLGIFIVFESGYRFKGISSEKNAERKKIVLRVHLHEHTYDLLATRRDTRENAERVANMVTFLIVSLMKINEQACRHQCFNASSACLLQRLVEYTSEVLGSTWQHLAPLRIEVDSTICT